MLANVSYPRRRKAGSPWRMHTKPRRSCISGYDPCRSGDASFERPFSPNTKRVISVSSLSVPCRHYCVYIVEFNFHIMLILTHHPSTLQTGYLQATLARHEEHLSPLRLSTGCYSQCSTSFFIAKWQYPAHDSSGLKQICHGTFHGRLACSATQSLSV